VEALRVRQIKNFLLTIAISRGVPMLLGGDEFRRSQSGNNNAYCQDNETSWVDWSLLKRNIEVFEFARGALALRRAYPVLRREAFYTDEEIAWFHPSGMSPDWLDPRENFLACAIRSPDGADLFLMFNAQSEAIHFACRRLVTSVPGASSWTQFTRRRLIACALSEECLLANPASYAVQAHSSVILVSR
jgi:isoamylase